MLSMILLAWALSQMSQQPVSVSLGPWHEGGIVGPLGPLDVPAVMVELPEGQQLLTPCTIYEKPNRFGHCTTHEKRWTCSDRSRILLTAEDDTRHCIKLPPQEKVYGAPIGTPGDYLEFRREEPAK